MNSYTTFLLPPMCTKPHLSWNTDSSLHTHTSLFWQTSLPSGHMLRNHSLNSSNVRSLHLMQHLTTAKHDKRGYGVHFIARSSVLSRKENIPVIFTLVVRAVTTYN